MTVLAHLFEDIVNASAADDRKSGELVLPNGAVYRGKAIDGQLVDDQAQLQWPNGSSYRGQYSANKPNGVGIISWASGGSYNGEVVDGRRSGFGSFVDAKYSVAGDWKAGKLNGTAKVTCSDGSGEYQGQWADNQRNGRGTMTYPSGNTYEGDYVNGKRHGNGKMIWTSLGQSYEGGWCDGLPHGWGTYRWSIPQENMAPKYGLGVHKYVGEFDKGRRQGAGTFYYADGSVYRGSWLDNRKSGEGVFQSAYGRVVKGTWKFDRLEGGEQLLLFGDDDYVFDLSFVGVPPTQLSNDLNEIIHCADAILRAIYTRYASEVDDFACLYRASIWEILYEYGVLSLGVDLVKLDQMYAMQMKDHPLFHHRYVSPHDPNEPLLYRDFIQYLLLAGVQAYGSDFVDRSIPFPRIAASFWKVVNVNFAGDVQKKSVVDRKAINKYEHEMRNISSEYPLTAQTVLQDLKHRCPNASVSELIDILKQTCPLAIAHEELNLTIAISLYEFSILRKTISD